MVRLSCKVDARPELVEYQWMAGGEEVVEARGAGELLVEANRERSGQTVTCQARNKLGQGSADYVLDIQCKSLTTLASCHSLKVTSLVFKSACGEGGVTCDLAY